MSHFVWSGHIFASEWVLDGYDNTDRTILSHSREIVELEEMKYQ